ncbi:MAG: phosphoenolpyruvate--protein phosphotransferase [Planctomycetota bacterium]
MIQGKTVSPGVAIGPALVRDNDLDRVGAERVATNRVDEELNRFRAALDIARMQINDLKAKLTGKISTYDARIFDTHLAYLKDPVFITDVERLVIDEQMKLESAIAKVINDFDRVFKLVESEHLRERALDLRDVGIRVLRCLEPGEGLAPAPPSPAPDRYILCARDLSIVDMFSLGSARVDAIVTEELALTSHAATLARSMRIPTLMGARGLLKLVKTGDILLVDASSGQVHINPDERILGEYQMTMETADDVAPWVKEPTRTRDGMSISVSAAGGNHDDAERSVAYQMEGVGLYRSELLYLFDKRPPDEELLTKHFTRAAELTKGAPLSVRLLDVISKGRLEGLNEDVNVEANPALGVKSTRALFYKPELLRMMLRSVLRAGAAGNTRVLVPFVTDTSDVRRVKELIFDEKQALRKAKTPHAQNLPMGAIIEVPAAALGVKDLLEEVDFLAISLDGLVQYTLAADRENEDLRSNFQLIHPIVLRLVRDVVATAEAADRELYVYGEMAVNAHNVKLLIGAGVRRFGVAPVHYPNFKRSVSEIDSRAAKKLAADAMRCSAAAELEQLIVGYHG